MNHQWIKQCAFLLLSCCLLPCFASSSTDSNRKTASAAKRLTIKATNGDKVAMRKLGLLHLKGINGKKDTSAAMQWLKKAAKKGDAPAMMHVGDLYRKGSGVNKNTPHAMTYYADCFKTMQAENNGLLCENSLPVIQRIKKIALKDSIYWWTARCNEGDMHALYYLATLDQDNRAGIISDGTARKYLINAAKKGHEKAKSLIESSPRKQYLTYWKSIIEAGDSDAAYCTAIELYNNNNCTEKEKSKAEEYFILAAKSGNKDAMQWLKDNNPECAKEIENDLNFRYKGPTPKNLQATYALINAAHGGAYWLYEKHINEGADINFFDDKEPVSAFALAMLSACKSGEKEGIEIMLRHVPNIYLCSRHGDSIFSYIWRRSLINDSSSQYTINYRHPYTEAITELLINLIDISSVTDGKLSKLFPDGNSPIIHCALGGFKNGLQKLISMGFDPDDGTDASALSLIICNRFKPAVHGDYTRTIVNPPPGYVAPPSRWVKINVVNLDNIIDCFNILLANGANVNHIFSYKDDNKTIYRTPLLVAIDSDLEPIVLRLIKEGGNPNLIIHDNVNLLEYALKDKSINSKYIRILIEAGGKLSNDSEARAILEKDPKLMYIYKKRHKL